MSNNNETVSLRTTILSILTLVAIAIDIYEGLRRLAIALSPNPIMLLPVLIASAGFIGIFYQPIVKMYKKLFKE